jgi:aspartate aminotransferase
MTVNGLSKGFAMTGWRIGYMAGPPEWISACEKYQGMISSGANTIGQAAGIMALNKSESGPLVDRMLRAFENRRNLMGSLISDIPGFNTNIPEGAFYYFPEVQSLFGKKTSSGESIHNADDLCLYLLQTAHVATVSGSAFGAPNCIRLSYATSDNNIVESMERIKRAVEQLN